MVLSIALAAPIGKRKDVIGRQTLPPRRTENGRGAGAPRRTENGKRRTERAASARRVGRRENGQASKLGQTQRCRLSQRTRRTTKIHKARRRGTADFGEHRGSRRRQRITESGEVLPHAGRRRGSLEAWRLGSLDRPHAARLSQRTRRTTKDHKGDGTTRRRAVRARKAHVRPGGLREHGGLRTPCVGLGKPQWVHDAGEPQIKGVLAHAGLPRGASAPWRTENGACSGGAANLP